MKEKFLLISTLVFLASMDIQAQLHKGDWLLGATIGLNFNNAGSTGTSSSNAGIAPHIGLSTGRNSVIGIRSDINYYSSSGENTNFAFSINLVYRKYHALNNKLGWYLQDQFGTGWTESKQTAIDSAGVIIKLRNSAQFYVISTIPGIYYLVSPGIMLNVDCGGMNYYYYNQGGGSWSSSFHFDLFSSFTFGVDFVLGKRKI